MTKPTKRSLFVVLVIVGVFLWIVCSGKLSVAHAQSSALSGYAWSSNIGWISFNGPGYAVALDPNSGALSGYAWSSSIGWIKFGGLATSSMPASAGTTATNATVSLSTYVLTGWIRACAGTINASNPSLPGDCSSMTSRTDGWDGWISLSGIAQSGDSYGVVYAPFTGNFSGYAWGSDVVGWMLWNPINGVTTNPNQNAPAVTLTTSSSTLSSPSTVTLTWSATNNPTSCSTSGGYAWPNPWTSGVSSGSATSPLVSNTGTVFEFQCSNASGQSNPASVTINMIQTQQSTTPSGVSMWLNNSMPAGVSDPSKAKTRVAIHPSGHVTLNWDGTEFTNQFPSKDHPSCSGSVTTGQSVPGWSTTVQPQALNNSASVVILSRLSQGTYTLDLTCSANVSGTRVASTSNPVTIVVQNSTIREQ